jgi:hypothetical protein
VTKLVARLIATAALWVRNQTFPKNTLKSDISKTILPAKKYTKIKQNKKIMAEFINVFFQKSFCELAFSEVQKNAERHQKNSVLERIVPWEEDDSISRPPHRWSA